MQQAMHVISTTHALGCSFACLLCVEGVLFVLILVAGAAGQHRPHWTHSSRVRLQAQRNRPQNGTYE
jgi:hypothetical protein